MCAKSTSRGGHRNVVNGMVSFDARWDHEPYSGRDGAPPPSAQRNGRTVDWVALRHRGRGRRRSAVPTLTGFRECLYVNFDAHWGHDHVAVDVRDSYG